jgi:hypothetical protein
MAAQAVARDAPTVFLTRWHAKVATKQVTNNNWCILDHSWPLRALIRSDFLFPFGVLDIK